MFIMKKVLQNMWLHLKRFFIGFIIFICAIALIAAVSYSFEYWFPVILLIAFFAACYSIGKDFIK